MKSTPDKQIDASNPAKYAAIFRELQQQILTGKYSPGERIPSEAALVNRYKVSRPTVSRALRELELLGLVERKAGSGSFVRNKLQPDGEPATIPKLGVLIPWLDEIVVFETITSHLASLALNHSYPLIWGGQHGSAPRAGNPEPEATLQLCRQLIERRVTGVFFAPFEWLENREEINQRIINELTRSGATVVLLDRDICNFPFRSNLDLIGMDNFAAGYMMAEHLIKLGCRRICFFALPLSASAVEARVAGVRDALLKYGIYPEADWILAGDPEDPAIADALMRDNRWDACICSNDRKAAQILQNLIRKGVRIPHDIRLAGFDNVSYATLVGVPLTTIHQPCDEIATLAFEAMLRRMNNPLTPACSFIATPRLVVRESCGAYLKTAH